MKHKPFTVIAFDETSRASLAEFIYAVSPQDAALGYAQMYRESDRVIVAVLAGEQQVSYPEGASAEHVSDLAELADEEEEGDE
ncbi:MAG: hypothetical protein HS116_21095 [Planctomycetes bacterium]|nr:hypothetical protein [Planctomycetota bacterium]